MTRLTRYGPSPAMIAACLALTIAWGGAAQAIGGGPSQRGPVKEPPGSIVTLRETVSAGIADVTTARVDCPKSMYALSGGYQVTSGNFLYVLTAATTRKGTGYVATVVVPNKISNPGVKAARITLKVLCTDVGGPVVIPEKPTS
jgi:hypothetical protein